MKRIFPFNGVCAFICIALLISSCVMVKGPSHKIPPGQMKKLTGSQSAKPYAPGQVKKKH